jgi:hypothetical protein
MKKQNLIPRGDELPRGVSKTGSSGPARVRGQEKIVSIVLEEILKASLA